MIKNERENPESHEVSWIIMFSSYSEWKKWFGTLYISSERKSFNELINQPKTLGSVKPYPLGYIQQEYERSPFFFKISLLLIDCKYWMPCSVCFKLQG